MPELEITKVLITGTLIWITFLMQAPSLYAQSSAAPDPSAASLQTMQAQTDSSSSSAPDSNSSGSSSSPTDPQSAVAKPFVLRGSAEMHAEALPPVDPSLQAGSIYNEQNVPKLQPNNDWYWIPSWYAGVKHIETQTILQDYDFRTGETLNAQRTVLNRQDLPIGFQMDRNGQIWELKRAPYEATTDSGGAFTKTFVRSREPVQVSQSAVVVKLVETSVMVDKRTNRIVRTLQEEQINTYTPIGGGAMNMKTSIKAFDANGRAQMLETSVRNATQISPFQPINNYQGMDTRSMFRDFMIAKGMANLLPPDLAPPSPEAAFGNQYGQFGMPLPPTPGLQPPPPPAYSNTGFQTQTPQPPTQGFPLQYPQNAGSSQSSPPSQGPPFGQTAPRPADAQYQNSANPNSNQPVVIDDPSAPPVAPARN